MQRRLLCISGAAVIAIGSWFFCDRSGEPKLVIKSRDIDMGFVSPGEYVESEIEIGNQGSGKLVISGIRTSCKCSDAKIGKNVLNPSENTVIKVTVKGSPNPSSSAIIHLISNDKKTPVTELRVWFRSRSGIWAEPDMISFGHLDSRAPLLTREFSIKGDRENGLIQLDRLEIAGDSCFREAFTCQKLVDKYGNIRVKVMPQANGPYGMINGKLNINDEFGNHTSVKLEAYAPHVEVISLLKPVILQWSNGICEGSGSIVLQNGFKGSVISSRIIDEPMIQATSILNSFVVSLDCQTRGSLVGKRFTAEIYLKRDFNDEIIRVWIPVVIA
jgi:hypothetical protein